MTDPTFANRPARDATIDIVRGMAVFTMVAANLAAAVLVKPHPFWFRFYGSFAAPIFVVLSGMMTARNARTKGRGFGYFFVRGLMLLATAGILDCAVWNVWPFMGMDVLCLLGVAMPIAYLAAKLPRSTRWLLMFGIFAVAPTLRRLLGYADYPTTITLAGDWHVVPNNPTGVIAHWIADGWFPLFPWLGLSIFGVQLAELRPRDEAGLRRWNREAIAAGVAYLIVGVGLWILFPSPMHVRGEYSEVFYPATDPYLVTAMGAILLLLLGIVPFLPERLLSPVFGVLGESALALYVLHFILIRFPAEALFEDEPFVGFLVVYACMLALLYLAAYGIRFAKEIWPRMPMPFRFLLGG